MVAAVAVNVEITLVVKFERTEKRFVDVALVVEAFVAKRLVVVALSAVNEAEYKFVEVELVPVAFTQVRLVVDAVTAPRFEMYEFVEVALVEVALVKVASVAENGLPVKLTAPVTVRSPFTVVVASEVSPTTESESAAEMLASVMLPPVIVGLVRARAAGGF